MRIALVASGYRPRSDGLDRHVGKLAAALARRGAHVEVLTQDAGRRASRLVLDDGVLVRRFLLPLGASHGAVAPGLWDALRRSSRAFDLVHVHTPHPSFAAVVMRIGPRSKVFTPHVSTKALTRWPYMRVTRAVVEHAALTLCTSIPEVPCSASETATRAVRSQRYRPASPTGPTKWTRDSTRRSSACAASRRSAGPAPAITSL